MLDYVLNGGIVTLPGFFPANKYWDIKRDLDENLEWRESHQPFKNQYGNRLQAFPCYESPYDKENDFTINKLEGILQTKLCDFKTIARKIVLSEIKQSPQNFGKYGFIHRDTSIEDKKPLIAAVMYFDQAYDGGTAFFHTQMERVPDIYISAIPNRLVLYSGGMYHAPCFDYTFKERKTISYFFRLQEKDDKQKEYDN